MNGGQPTQVQRQQLGTEMQGVRQQMAGTAMQNGYAPQGTFGGHHHRYQFNGAMGSYNYNGSGMGQGDLSGAANLLKRPF